MNVEGAPAGGGGAPVVVPPAAPAVPPTPAAPVVPVTPVVAPPAVPIVEVKASAPEAKPEPAKAEPPAKLDMAAEFEAYKAKTAELEQALAKANTETRKLAFDAAFDKAGVAPTYRDFLRSQVGDVDPRSEAGLKAIDDVAKKHPAMLVAHVSTEDPMATFLRAKADEARKAGTQSMWGLIPVDMVRGYDIKGGE